MPGRYWNRPFSFTKGKHISFNGIHNRVKGKCFLVLAQHSCMTSSNLAKEANCKYESVMALLSRWSSYAAPYVLRHKELRHGHMVYIYRLSARGKRFIDERIPVEVRDELESELGIDPYNIDLERIAAIRARIQQRFRERKAVV